MSEFSSTAAFFDLDKTIIATSASTAFSKPFYDQGLLTRSAAIRTAYEKMLFMMGHADERQTNRLRDSLSTLVKGWEAAKVRAIVEETLAARIDPAVYQEAVALIRRHQANGRDVVIISASGTEVVEPIARMLGADHVIATRLDIVDGRYTGAIEFYAFGENKAIAMRELAAERGYDLEGSYAYSDSMTDAPMLDAVGFGFAVNPDRAMRTIAVQRGWGVLTFERPVALKVAVETTPLVTIGIAAVVIAAAAIIWRASVRRRRTAFAG